MNDIDPVRITVVEPNAELHPRIAGFIAEMAEGSRHSFDLKKSVDEMPAEFDLAVIATNADVRKAVFDRLTSHARMRTVVFEKVLFQTLGDIDEVGMRLARDGSKGFVNCGRRGFPGYQRLRDELAPSRPLSLNVTGTDFGLASNTIHFLDLAEYLNDARLEAIDLSGLHPGSVPAKRQGQVEVYGKVSARLTNGATVELSCEATGGPAIVELRLRGDGLEIFVDEAARKMTVNGDLSSGEFAARHVSEMPHIYSEALRLGTPCLTDYAASAHQHRLFIAAMRDHLGLSNAADEPCPIS